MTAQEVIDYIKYCLGETEKLEDCTCCLGMVLLADKLGYLDKQQLQELLNLVSEAQERAKQKNITLS